MTKVTTVVVNEIARLRASRRTASTVRARTLEGDDVAKSAERQPAPLGRVELELLQFVDRRPGVSVGDAATEFGGPRGLARTTVLTMMQRLTSKGYLQRRLVDSVYRYEPKISARRAVSEVVSDFVRSMLGGSVSPFVAYLSESQNLTEGEVADLRKLVDQLERRDPESSARSPSETKTPRPRRSSREASDA